ncbi:MAG: tetraacyldisaccharide 4'-kinase [Acidobacteria bacterium]|nr:tetraacyldisaccharide 4'-kinase [Acidobacteriota bacterium]
MISTLVAAFARRRRAACAAHPERRRRLERPVISIGNLSMGGTGKTPLVAHVARLLLAAGHRPAILSRGYARPRVLEGVVVVSDGTRALAPYATAGDEPLMLARQVPGCAVVVAPDRYVAGALAERRLGCTVHVLDDGFQHLSLARALDIVIVSGRDMRDRVLPFGRLREPLDALAAADALVAQAGDEVDPGGRPLFRMMRRVAERRDEPALAFAGIGRPAAFFQALEEAGWTVVARVEFADHHSYSARDLERLARDATRAGARILVTTEKDAVRLETLPPPALPLVAAPLEVSVEPAAEFAAMLHAACGRGSATS